MTGAEGSGLLGYAEMLQYADAVVDALGSSRCPPNERWDEARAIALYWTPITSGPDSDAWTHGLVVFWRMTDGWHCAPLDAHGDPALDDASPLPLGPVASPATVSALLPQLLRGPIHERPEA
ncbi:hypothetical protein OH809_15565 [Streptomyces sp. NBC_00873]|uniref:hypothetical protein n=1 Tax=unclassified Streptomyces TaxID=2593676 RepID=UPI003868FC0B|nr:hypothetical protein OH809_15565 [Streptomyces sp. NBC_00873]WTA46013.1 hypothetical protein OH821_28115 [Streptomyces sp. NBC_00842]